MFPEFERPLLDEQAQDAPLADRMRPRTLAEFVGQRHLLSEGAPLRTAIEFGALPSMILWGPPGVGKTTLARLIARQLDAVFVPLSAVTSGVKQVREAAAAASARRAGAGRRTLLFLDEVHRFNKSQQDILLPFVEDGTLILIGATTENPSFELNRALLSRAQLYVLEALDASDLLAVLQRAAEHPNGLGGPEIQPAVLERIARWAGGDARRALNALEIAAHADALDSDGIDRVLQRRTGALDKGGEHFYNLTSALHKSVRGSDPDAALYWLARMVQGGADLRYLARRLLRMASEDIGLADPNALKLAVAARDSADFLGPPEGELALAQITLYLALAPKSNRLYRAWDAASRLARNHPDAEVPLHLRNAPTEMMESLGYGAGYSYYFDDPEGSFAQPYLPPEVPETPCYLPGDEGWEQRVAQRLDDLRLRRDQARRALADDR